MWFMVLCLLLGVPMAQAQPIPIDPPHVSTDPSVRLTYNLIYVRSPRTLPCTTACPKSALWAEFSRPTATNAGTDLMLWRHAGHEEVLVQGGAGAIQDPVMSLDGTTVYFTRFHVAGPDPNKAGADIYKLHLASRKVTRLTTQTWATNRGLIPANVGVYNMHPCPVPGGRVVYVSTRNAYLPPVNSYPDFAWQLHAMDEDGANIKTIGPMNLGSALHPVLLTSGKVMFSSLENMGLRIGILWGIWDMAPDGTNWGPVMSAFLGNSAPAGFHFQTQLTDGRIVVEQYYNQNQKGFGTFLTIPPPPMGEPAFGPGDTRNTRNPQFTLTNGKKTARKPFSPTGIDLLTRWAWGDDAPALMSDPTDQTKPLVGKVTHPHGAPENHLLLTWTKGPIGGSSGAVKPWMTPTPIDSGIYVLKSGIPIDAPADMRLVLDKPDYNEQWPVPVVSWVQVYGSAPPILATTSHPALDAGVPFGLVGTSSLYKRDSAPLGSVPEGEVTAVSRWDTDARQWNWKGQGSDAGRYENSEMHALRILTFEPNPWTPGPTLYRKRPHYQNAIGERLRILGEIPVRKYAEDGTPVLDPDGNPDTSFLARIPADVPFTFQTIDKDGLVLNMAQTWHQVRPGEARYDCGGCHAHSQKPTLFEETAAAQPDYRIVDLTGVNIARVYTREADIPAGVTLNLDDKAQVIPLQSRCSPGYWVLAGQQYDCPGVTPLPADTVLSDHPLTTDELAGIARLIDTGGTYGPAGAADDTKPTLVVSWPMPGPNVGPLTQVRLGMHDLTAGLDMASLSVTLNGTELATTCTPLPEWRWACPLVAPLTSGTHTLGVRVTDRAGNTARIDRTFTVVGSPEATGTP